MNDRDFLIWLHDRLVGVHGENQYSDYMYKLRAIIAATPSDRITPNAGVANTIEELRKTLELHGQIPTIVNTLVG